MKHSIPSYWLPWALRRKGPVYFCANCGDRMWVRKDSGLCPHCFNGRKPLLLPEPVTEVTEAVALAGVLDDPAVEEDVEAFAGPRAA